MSESKKIGRYLVERLLGEGAMGNVFKATDPYIKRAVAIKTVKLDQSQDEKDIKEFQERFTLEAQISGHLNHPNIVSVFDVGEQDGVPYIAMEYVEGLTLSEVVKDSPCPTPLQLVRILLQIAGALDFAHGKGVIHRDLKPSNIMVMSDGVAKIMDFGIAKMSGSKLTQTGIFLGTPSYSSPEQIKEGHVDARSDIFSFAILAHETLTGHLPFPGQSINAILYKIANEPPTLAPNLKGLGIDANAWRKVFTRALDKNPEQRFQKAADFVNALVGCLSVAHLEANGQSGGGMDETIRVNGIQKDLERSDFELGQTNRMPRVQPPPRRKRRRALPALAAILFLTAAAAGVFLWQTGQWRPYWETIGGWFGAPPTVVASSGSTDGSVDSTPAVLAKDIAIDSNPSGAAVFFNDQQIGKTPLSHRWEGPPGESATLRLALADHADVTRELTLAESLAGSITETLKPRPIERVVKSEPTGATVRIDGQKRGETPLKFSFSPGDIYKLRISKNGYYARDVTFHEGKSKPSALEVTLNPVPPPGELRVTSDMEPLTIAVNGKKHKSGPVKLKPGSYQVVLAAPAYFYRQTFDNVEIASGAESLLKTPEIITIPRIDFLNGFAKVKINGRFVESDGEPDTTPMVNFKIAAGKHTFQFLDLDDNIVAEKTLEVVQGESIIEPVDR